MNARPLILFLSAAILSAEPLAISIYNVQKQPNRRVLMLNGQPQAGRSYKVDDKLGDPVDFIFAASNTLGVFEIGDRVPLFSTTKLAVHVAGEHTLRVVCNGETVAEAKGPRLEYTAKGPSSCVAQVAKGDALWIETEPIVLERPDGSLRLPSNQLDATVEGIRDIPYADAHVRQRLDIYAPRIANA
ncbi:MAG: hypothetical protein QM813_00720 [Verrucomicrobiota bacterium]